MEPSPEPRSDISDELLKAVVATDDDELCATVGEDVQAIMDECRRMVMAMDQEERDDSELKNEGEEDTEGNVSQFVEESDVANVDDKEPSWFAKKVGPWAARHRNALRAWLLALLALYVSLFVSMLARDGLRGLSERSPTATVRDLLWTVLMGLIVVLALGKYY